MGRGQAHSQGYQRRPVPRTVRSLGAFLDDDWLPAVRTRLEDSTWASYERNLRLHVFPYIGGVQLQGLDPAHLNRLCADLAVVALGRGAGLDESVLRHLKGCHVYWWGDFLVVHDPATRRHPVAVDPNWGWVVEGLAVLAGPEGYLVRPSLTDRTSRPSSPISPKPHGLAPRTPPTLTANA